MNNLSDQTSRLAALDEKQSFLVQAPAGSGKTELLTQRFLKLLGTSVKQPEEIIAITFTRKAAFEMRQRIIHALTHSKGELPSEPHQQQTYQLAKQVLNQDKRFEWQLLENPHRLRILTIDSLCAKLTSQMPILSQFGFQPGITDQASRFYEEAAENILCTLNQDVEWQSSLKTLLLHLDNDHEKAKRLLTQMLMNRDQWLMHAFHLNREDFEEILRKITESILTGARKILFNLIDEETLLTLWQHARIQLATLAGKTDTSDAPPNLSSDPENFLVWQSLCQFLMTTENQIRKTVNIKQGFLPKSKSHSTEENHYHEAMKTQMLSLLETLRDNAQLTSQLNLVKIAPGFQYEDAKWALVEALVEILKLTTAQLHLLFKEHKTVDHTEVALRAVMALGHFDSPSDLALALDNQINHILVDEFQDTSITQFKLLEKLTAGWTTQDGRTLFLVGDPMQSIYRFRKAEVGLFLLVKQQGIGAIQPQFLALTANFRSSAKLIDWFNDYSSNLFPRHENLETGAITFAKATPTKTMLDGNVHVVAIPGENDETEAAHILKIMEKYPDKRIAVLSLAKNHFSSLIPALHQAQIPFRAIELSTLANKVVCQDLLALSGALLQPYDKVAWLSILRAPFCGLSLADLYALSQTGRSSLFHALLDFEKLQLTEEGKIILQRVLPVLKESLDNRERLPFSMTLEITWLNLGGPACLKNHEELENAQCFFAFLKPLEKEHEFLTRELIERQLNSFAVNSKSDESRIELMTIHKAKGLEFDVVILPSLEKSKRIDNHPLLLFQEFPSEDGFEKLLVAPLKNDDADLIYDYLRYLEQQKARYEHMRLLYVAMTRAKEQLYLIAKPKIDETQQYLTPNAQSFLSLLWPVFESVEPAAIPRDALSESSSVIPRDALSASCTEGSPESPEEQMRSLRHKRKKRMSRDDSRQRKPLVPRDDRGGLRKRAPRDDSGTKTHPNLGTPHPACKKRPKKVSGKISPP